MKRPTKIAVFGKEIVIKYENVMHLGYLGKFDPEKFEITIEKTLIGKALVQTLLHELFHAVFDRLGFEQLQISLDAQEMWCDNLATFLTENFELRLPKNNDNA